MSLLIDGLAGQSELFSGLAGVTAEDLSALEAALAKLGEGTLDADDPAFTRFKLLFDRLLQAADGASDPLPAAGALQAELGRAHDAVVTPTDDISSAAADALAALESLLAFAHGQGYAAPGDRYGGGNPLPSGGSLLPASRDSGTLSALNRSLMDLVPGELGGRITHYPEGTARLIAVAEHAGSDRSGSTLTGLQEMLGGQWNGLTASAGSQVTAGPAGYTQAPGGSGLAQPTGTPAWGQGLAERVSWMVREGMARAELALNPPRLGRLEVRLRVDADQVSLSFASQSSQVRDALEQALPRLREFLAEGGLQLADANIGAGTDGGHADGDTGTSADPDSADKATVQDEEPTPGHGGRSLVDLYA